MGVEFICDELGSIEDYPKPRQGFAHVLISGGELIRARAFMVMGLSVQYRGKPSRAVGSRLVARTLKNFPFHPLNEFWKSVRMMRPTTPEKLIHRLFPCFFTSKK